MIDTYYRQLHLPQEYFNQIKNITFVPDFTCTLQPETNIYYENPDGGEYFCYCDGNAYNGLPSFTFTYFTKQMEYYMTPSQYLFEPYLNYTSGFTKCVMSLAGPTRFQASYYGNDHVLILGQRFFSEFPLFVQVDRTTNDYTITVGGATNSEHNNKLLIIIFSSMSVTVIILLVLIYKMIKIRKRRLEADEWLNENQAKLINYALQTQTKPEE